MLKPEQAQERLKSFYDEGWKVRRSVAVAVLWGRPRKPARAILADQPYASTEAERRAREQATDEAAQQLDELRPAERRRLFEALFPALSPCVDGAWQLLHRLPYQEWWHRKAFRAPNTPRTTRLTRFHWLQRLHQVVGGYDQDVIWLAAWAPYLGWNAPDTLGVLFAAAIDAGDSQGGAVFDVLCASARGEHEVGAMGRHVTRGLLAASRPEGWAFVEKLLLAAQRQEGLRQTILETIDEAHPEAFRRMLRLILDHDLARFSATVRAVDVWLGLQLDSGSPRAVNEVLSTVLQLLQDSSVRSRALQSADGQTVYLALWALAFEDAVATVEPAAGLLGDDRVERRFAAAHLLAQLGLVGAGKALFPALADADLRVVARATMAMQRYAAEIHRETDLFERLERALPRFPRQKTALKPIIWAWMALPVEQSIVAGLLVDSLGSRSPRRLIPHLPAMNPADRHRVARLLAETKPWEAETRATLFALVGDPAEWVREEALKAIGQGPLSDEEATSLERLLTRQAGDLRRGVISMLLGQEDERALASADRLLASTNPLQRLAGLEMLHQMKDESRKAGECHTRAERYLANQAGATEADQSLLDAILDRERTAPTLDDALGLLDPGQRTKPTPPEVKRGPLFTTKRPPLGTSAPASCLKQLDDLIHQHRNVAFTLADGAESQEVLLGNARWLFPSPALDTPPSEDAARLPLRELWETWLAQRPAELRDDDGFEILRALARFFSASRYYYHQPDDPPGWLAGALKTLFAEVDQPDLQYPGVVREVLKWLSRLHPPSGAAEFLLDTVEFSLTRIPGSALAMEIKDPPDPDWPRHSRLLGWLELARYHRSACPLSWEDAHHLRLWRLLRWLDEPAPGRPRYRPHLEEALAAFRLGAATEADLVDHLLGPRPQATYGRASFGDLRSLTGRKPSPLFDTYPILRELVDRCRQRIIEVELVRGDLPTAASSPALDLCSVGGASTLVRLLQALGREGFVRGWASDSLSRAAVFSHLVGVTSPTDFDTLEGFATQVKAAHIPLQRLVELTVYAPQWASHVEHALAWPGLAEAVWWIHAHTKERSWHALEETREEWTALLGERTPLSARRLLDGAVDVAWFHKVYGALQQARWDVVYAAAAYASSGRGHARARQFADAMLGRIGKAELVARIRAKRHQDSVRGLGLLPLAAGDGRDDDLLERYKVIQEFVRTSRQFGPQRQANEKLAATIALENLARTAGYPDPQRLEWAMEARAIADLAGGPVAVTVGDMVVSLAIDPWGEPDLAVARGGKALKSVPAQARKDPSVAELLARKQDIRRQASRMRASLEQAMCRGDRFTGAELRDLFTHPVLAPMLRGLVFVGDGGIGYPIEGGLALQSHDGVAFSIGKSESLRIAHPYDLLATNEWHLWQRECFSRERIQPFKQVFRELYVLTGAERADGTLSRRYAGHQVNPRQALALLGQRGWVNYPEEGVRRTFHDLGLSAWLTFLGGAFTPAEVEGLTVENVAFTRQGEWKPLPLTDIPPRVFSETMRDLDLVVSVAHRGGVDPEASASTVEMRASLIRETCALLKIANVRIQGSHALIEGHLGSYSVHLGSAVVHRQPGGALCIVPVHAQRRGRLFLPFADDDPRTAEVLSKVLLLARDTEIKDPTILEQILS